MVDFAKINKAKREYRVQEFIKANGLTRDGHAIFSPSSSAGWINCKGFILANLNRPDGAGVDAAYGTVAHEIAAKMLIAKRDNGRMALDQTGCEASGKTVTENGYAITIDDDMIHHIRRYIDWCEEVEFEGDVFVEQRVDYSQYTPIPGQGGTADFFVAKPGHLIIIDLKMGIKVRVYAEWNTQAMLYALGVYLEWNWVYGFKMITIRICQPRVGYFGTWEISVEELLKWAEDVMRPAAEASLDPKAPRSPGPKQCQWCRAIDCPARSTLLEDLADDAFDDDEVVAGRAPVTYTAQALKTHITKSLRGPLPKEMEPTFDPKASIALMSWRYAHRGMFDKYFRQIGEELMRLKMEGVDIPEWKIVTGRNSYVWSDEDHAVNELAVIGGLQQNEIFKTEVTSVNQATKALKTKGMKQKEISSWFFGDKTRPKQVPLVRVQAGKPTLAPASDERADLSDEADDGFDD